MFNSAVSLALVTMIAWGFWAIFAKVATRTLLPTTTTVVSYGAAVVVTGVYIALSNKAVSPTGIGTGFAVLAGMASGIGAICLYMALSRGDAAVVTTISALYFAVAAVLGVLFFGETVTLTDAIGLVLAVVAISFLTF